MAGFIRTTDDLLRGRFTRSDTLRSGQIKIPARRLTLTSLVLGMAYGVFMGLYALMREDNESAAQLFATTVKVPLLFLATLAVTFPSLYVLSALAGSRLRMTATLRLLLIAVAVDLALLASFGPIVAFFTLSTTSYPFMVLLNVFFFGVSGIVGLHFLARSLDIVFIDDSADASVDESKSPEAASDSKGEPTDKEKKSPEAESKKAEERKLEQGEDPAEDWVDPLSYAKLRAKTVRPSQRPVLPDPVRRSRTIFRIWVFIYGVVGAQMGWILRPFIGDPRLPFSWFRERESNFLFAVTEAIVELFS